MPYRFLNIEEAADDLCLTPADIQERVKHREIPFEKRGERFVFRRCEIESWASSHLISLPALGLAAYHQKSTRAMRKILPTEVILPKMLESGTLDSAMTAKTKASVLRELVELASKTGQVCDPKELLTSLVAREKHSSTAVPGGSAFPHPHVLDPHLFESSFLVVGRTLQGIHFGASDGQPTNLFFLICCQDERMHLHTLARLCLMAQKTDVLAQLREVPNAPAMRERLIAAEERVTASYAKTDQAKQQA